MRCFAFLRAINISDRRLTNDEQIEPLVDLGFEDVAAYQAAGNLTFAADDARVGSAGAIAELEREVETAVATAFGFESDTFVLTAPDLRGVVGAQPFRADQVAATEGRTQVTVMRSTPDDSTWARALDLAPDDDLLALGDRVWYWLPRTGISGSKLPVAKIEGVVGPMTMRTMGTLERMLAKFDVG